MNEFLKVLLNVRSLRAACRELTLEQLEEGLEKLSAIVSERQQDEAAERQAREEHLRKINEYAEMLKAAGIDPAELVGTVAVEPATRQGQQGQTCSPPGQIPLYGQRRGKNLDRPRPYAFRDCQGRCRR